jgi:hypothetical protein
VTANATHGLQDPNVSRRHVALTNKTSKFNTIQQNETTRDCLSSTTVAFIAAQYLLCPAALPSHHQSKMSASE